MAIKAQISRLSLQRKPVIGLMRIMTAHAIALRCRCMQMFLEHHVPASIVAAETKFFFLNDEFELVIIFVRLDVADCADPSPYRTMNVLQRSHD
jgi:hypothetical protein